MLVNKAIHKSAPINSRKGNRTIGSSTSKSQILQVVGIGIPLSHSTPYFLSQYYCIPEYLDTRALLTGASQTRKYETSYSIRNHGNYRKTACVTVPNPTAVASAAAAPFRSHGVAAARAIQHILLGEISCRSQRIDSTRSRGWVVQSRD